MDWPPTVAPSQGFNKPSTTTKFTNNQSFTTINKKINQLKQKSTITNKHQPNTSHNQSILEPHRARCGRQTELSHEGFKVVKLLNHSSTVSCFVIMRFLMLSCFVVTCVDRHYNFPMYHFSAQIHFSTYMPHVLTSLLYSWDSQVLCWAESTPSGKTRRTLSPGLAPLWLQQSGSQLINTVKVSHWAARLKKQSNN